MTTLVALTVTAAALVYVVAAHARLARRYHTHLAALARNLDSSEATANTVVEHLIAERDALLGGTLHHVDSPEANLHLTPAA